MPFRDRKRLKIIQDVKRQARLHKHAYTNQGGSDNTPRHNGIEIPDIDIKVVETEFNGPYRFGPDCASTSGINSDRLYGQNSVPNSKSNGDTAHRQCPSTSVPNHNSSNTQNKLAKYDGISHNATILNPSSLSRDCMSVTKILRRQSYEVAVAQFSLLQQDPPKYAKSSDIHTVYEGKTSTTAYENRAYEPGIGKDNIRSSDNSMSVRL